MSLTFVLFLLAPAILAVWALADAATRPDWAFVAAGRKKVLWVILTASAFVVPLVGLLPSIVYLLAIRPKVQRAQTLQPGATPLGPDSPPGWRPDPFRRHQLRYWSGADWTEHVTDAGRPSTDPAV